MLHCAAIARDAGTLREHLMVLLIGNNRDNALFIEQGTTPTNDIIEGLGGQDYLNGAEGNDSLYGGDGLDIVRGSFDDDVVEGAPGSDFVEGGPGDDRCYGGGDDDSYDILDGLNGNDTLYGGGGGDSIYGGIGADKMYGGDGGDYFAYNTVNESNPRQHDVIVDFDPDGGDKIDLSSIDAQPGVEGAQDFAFIGTDDFDDAGQVRYEIRDHSTYIEVNTRGDGEPEMVIQLQGSHDLTADSFVFAGGDKLDTGSAGVFGGTEGTEGNDTFEGGGGNDYIYGGDGNDLLLGGGDSDILRGSFGDDTIDGGLGSDIMSGGFGPGRDTFRFTDIAFGDDIITDFRVRQDKIEFALDGQASFADLRFDGNTIIGPDGQGSITLSISTDTLTENNFIFT